MKTIFLGLAAIPLMGMGPVGTSIVAIGGSSAESCYHAAAARDTSANAMEECNSALDHETLSESDEIASYVNRGILSMIQTDYRSAEADFSRALVLDPNQAEATLNMGIAHYQQGRIDSAAKLFGRAIELRTAYPALAYFGRGLANEDRGDVPSAYADLRRASQLNPGWNAPAEELKRFQVVGKGKSI